MTSTPPTASQLIFWPVVITSLVSAARLIAEVQGWISSTSGGAGAWLGITWLIFVFGLWFALRLRRSGATTRLRWPGLFGLLALGIVVGATVWALAPLRDGAADLAAMREAITKVVIVTSATALATFVIWPRLAWTLLAYAIPARAVVFGITWLAKSMGWDTHYTKLGPDGLEPEMAETLAAVAMAQFGVWVPLTVVGGMAVGAWFGRRRES